MIANGRADRKKRKIERRFFGGGVPFEGNGLKTGGRFLFLPAKLRLWKLSKSSLSSGQNATLRNGTNATRRWVS